ncbi:hypothetical protein DCAR_0933793 [Daucus carota subsp. sativus]|uniref:Uncharacterized protein n=1 Tax=Daucus carota subsp. sativus TaxID=79200 RepID=A0AAF0XWS4_DAUCS|nr:hypothetical protein DCAR_0933793 [Daucus carota subsp. sativus]
MEILCVQKLIQNIKASTGKSAIRGHGMSHFLFRTSTIMSLLDSPVEIRENSIQFSMETEFCELSPELGEHFEIFEH